MIAESVMKIGSAEAVEALLSLVNAADPVLDVTYGNGTFWKDTKRQVIGYDINPARGTHGVCDFTDLSSIADGQYPTVVFDPPFHPFVGSSEEKRFSGMGRNEKELRNQFQLGVKECWRATSNHMLVKCQSFIHNHKPQWMPLWAIEVCGEPFEWLTALRDGKMESGRWKNVKSLRRRCAEYLIFSKRGNVR